MISTALKTLGKAVLAGIFVFGTSTFFCHYFYYNFPLRYINIDGSTDFKAMANTYYSYGLEGFGWGKMNNEGFTNLFDYDDNMNIDILIMGSSQMEALQLDMHLSTASQLDALLENETVYNIGVSGHYFLTCASNLKAALKKYQPTKYVVIETGNISFSDDEIVSAINEKTPELLEARESGKIVSLLRKSAYLRLIVSQMINYARNWQTNDVKEVNRPEAFSESDPEIHEKLWEDLLQKMNVLAKKYGAKVIIAYHPLINIAPDGAIILDAEQSELAQVERLCDENGILFLDMSSRFKEEYENTYTLPYGFSNSPVGKGHLNKYGHTMMADELYNLIVEDEQ